MPNAQLPELHPIYQVTTRTRPSRGQGDLFAQEFASGATVSLSRTRTARDIVCALSVEHLERHLLSVCADHWLSTPSQPAPTKVLGTPDLQTSKLHYSFRMA